MQKICIWRHVQYYFSLKHFFYNYIILRSFPRLCQVENKSFRAVNQTHRKVRTLRVVQLFRSFRNVSRDEKFQGLGVRLLRGGMHWIRVHVCKRVYVRTGVQHVRKRDRLPRRAARGPSFI